MAEVKRKQGHHKDGCTCKFCKLRAEKAKREGAAIDAEIEAECKSEADRLVASVIGEVDNYAKGTTETPQAPKETPVTNKVPDNTKKPVKVKEIGSSTRYNWPKFIGGLAIVVICLLLLVMGNAGKNAALIGIGAIGAVGGGYLALQGREVSGGQSIKGKKKLLAANCLTISATHVGHSVEEEDKLQGVPWRCRNDGKYRAVHFKGIDGNGSIEAFDLPDPNPAEQYYDPKEAVNVLTMTMTKKYFNYAPTTSQAISLIVLGVVVLIEIIGLVALGG